MDAFFVIMLQGCTISADMYAASSKESPSEDMVAMLGVYTALSIEVMSFVCSY